MIKGIYALLSAFLLSLILFPVALAQPMNPQEANRSLELVNSPELEEEFMDWGLGLFIHWGMDSQLGTVISHSMVGASGEYLDRFINELPKSFYPGKYDPEEWMRLASLAGARYMALTAKHHSGFCLWDTKTTDFSIMNTPYEKDIIRSYVDACRKYGLKVGFYFSPEDFWFLHKQGNLIRRRADYANISSNPELLAHDREQVRELLTGYGKIDVIFFDAFDNRKLVEYVHQLQPECLVTRGEMSTPEQEIPDAPMPGPWEACFTLGTQWQFKPTNEHYKSGQELIEMLINIRSKGGNLLLNIGPEPSGVIPMEQDRILRELGLWNFVNSEAIHGIRPWPVIREGNIWITRKRDEDTVYLFLTKEQPWALGVRREFTLTHVKSTPRTTISVLGQNSLVVEYNPDINPAAEFRQLPDSLIISVVRAQRLYNDRTWDNPLVVKLTNVEFR
ncbi:MAG: alpha-L-fucosidase [Acidobacteriota bacterium]